MGEAREGNGDNGVGICTPDSDRCGGAVAVLGVDTCPSTAGSHARHLMKAREKKALFHAQTKTAEYGIEEAGASTGTGREEAYRRTTDRSVSSSAVADAAALQQRSDGRRRTVDGSERGRCIRSRRAFSIVYTTPESSIFRLSAPVAGAVLSAPFISGFSVRQGWTPCYPPRQIPATAARALFHCL